MASARARITVESDGLMGQHGRVYYHAEDGSKVDISSCITGVDLHVKVGEPNRATLHVLLVEGRMDAEIEEIIVTNVKPRQPRWQRWWRDVTTIGQSSRHYA